MNTPPLTDAEIDESLIKQGLTLLKSMGFSPTELSLISEYVHSELFLGWLGHKLDHTDDPQMRQVIQTLMGRLCVKTSREVDK